jgi:hypothetical protein
MWRSFPVKLVSGVLAAALAIPAAPVSARGRDAAPSLVSRCPTTRNLAPVNWAEAANGETLDAWEGRIRGPLPFERPTDATAMLRAFGGGSETQQTPTDSVALVWRDAAGTWRFRKINHRTVVPPPPPPPPGSTEAPVDMEQYRREMLEGVLHRDQAAAWLGAHALFHLWEVAAGICGPDAIPRDFIGVTLPALLALALAFFAAFRGRTVTKAVAASSS